MSRWHLIQSLFCLAALSSCSNFNIVPADTDMTSTARIHYSWNDEYFLDGENVPDSVSVYMSRAVETIHYTLRQDKTGIISRSTAPFDTSSRRLFDVDHGKYYMLALGCGESSDSTQRYDFEGLEGFGTNLEVKMNEMVAALRRDTVHTIFSNSYPTYLEASPLYVGYNEENLESYTQVHDITFTPRYATTNIEFDLCFNFISGVKVTDVKAIITGIPTSVYLSSRYVTKENMGQVYFELPYSEDLTQMYGLDTFSSSFESLGLFSAQTADVVSGAGILTLYISYDNNGKSEKSLMGINLKNKIEQAGIMTTSDEVNYLLAKRKHSFVLTLSLDTVKKNFILVGEEAVKYWNIDYEEDVHLYL